MSVIDLLTDIPLKLPDLNDVAQAGMLNKYQMGHSGSSLMLSLLDGKNNLIARGIGVSWSDNNQVTPVMEYGHRKPTELIEGAVNAGQLQVQSLYFLQLNDSLGSYRDLILKKEFTAIVYIAMTERPEDRGTILDCFQGCKIASNQGSFNAQNMYTRNVNLMYRYRETGLEWASKSASTFYPAKSPGGQYPAAQ